MWQTTTAFETDDWTKSKEFYGKTAKNNEKKRDIRLTRQPKLYYLATKAKFAQRTPLFGNLKASNSTETDSNQLRALKSTERL